MKKIKIIFYKNKLKTFIDMSIYLFQLIKFEKKHAQYTHVEIYADGVGMSSSYLDGGVRFKRFNIKPFNWDYIELEVTKEEFLNIINFFKSQDDKKYDLINIFLTQLIPADVDQKNKWICSEIVAHTLKNILKIDLKEHPSQYPPALLAKELSEKYTINKFKYP